ncbi:hypothetical protein ACSFA3_15055 [Variovorax sp. RHLX14]|uniref:hypothetical protein n=1 Tax=Variovorax sp. RHLX14 TaxID=1259731 RepID=UPI003F4669FE
MTMPLHIDEPAPDCVASVSIPEELQGSLAALKRAALNAKKLAEQTGTDLIVVRSGLLVRMSPSQQPAPD